MQKYANPHRFMKLSQALFPWISAAAIILTVIGLTWGLYFAPPDYQQGDTVRIMFVHVPSAWMAMFCYIFMAMATITGFIWRHPVADLSAKAAAPIGAVFTLMALITGSLWGKPMWGAWWVWDARITSVLVLFFLYLGYIAIWEAIDEYHKAAKAAAILCLVGVINIPIIKYSVEWWNTLHQPASVARLDGPAIHSSILWPLLVMALAFHLIFFAIWIIRVRTEIRQRRLERLISNQTRGV